jgi:hypothetical protein
VKATKTLVRFLPLLFGPLFILPVNSQTNNGARPIVRSVRTVCGGYELDETLGARPLTSLNEARRLLDEVLDKSDIDKDLINLYSAKVGEHLGVACVDNGKTTILFDPGELNRIIKSSASEWIVKSIFAHEAGHHHRNHIIKKTKQANKELEADETAGVILAKLGASLREAKGAYSEWIGEDKVYIEEGITEYPLPSQRLDSLEKGWRSIKYVNIVWSADNSSLGHNYGHLDRGEWVATPTEASRGTYLAFTPPVKVPLGTYIISFLYRCKPPLSQWSPSEILKIADPALSFRVSTLQAETGEERSLETVTIPYSACSDNLLSISSWIFRRRLNTPTGTTFRLTVFSYRNAEVRLKEIRLEQLDSQWHFGGP